MDPLTAARLALILAIALSAIALIRLVVIKSYVGLPVLTFYLGLQLIQGVVSLAVSPLSHFYRFAYVVSEPVSWIILFLMVREMYRRAFSEFPGISSLVRWVAYVAGALAVSLCAVLLWQSGPSALLAPQTAVGYEVFWEQCVSFTLSAFLVFMLFLLSRYPISLTFSLAAHISVFSTNFLGTFLILHLFTTSSLSEQAWRNTGVSTLSACCFAAWALLLRPRSEDTAVRVRQHIDPHEEERLLLQLEGINRILVKSGGN